MAKLVVFTVALTVPLSARRRPGEPELADEPLHGGVRAAVAALGDEPVVDPPGGVALLPRGPEVGLENARDPFLVALERGPAPPSGASARRATCPPCRRTSPRCSGSRGALWRSRTSSARRHPSTVYHSLCPGARSSPPSFPGGLAKVTARGDHTAGAAPPVPGARPSCLNCSIFRAHGAYFPVITRTTS